METLIYHIENGGSTWQERTVDVSSPIKIMNIKINIPKEYALLCYIIVKDSNGKFRMFREIGYGPRTLIIGNDGMHTTAGGTAGDIPIGNMLCSVLGKTVSMLKLLFLMTFLQ